MKIIKVVAAIIKEKDKYLITQRKKGTFKDLWEFPGGKIENQETHSQAIIREIKEELNLTIEVNYFFKTIEYSYNDFKLIMHLYFCKIVSGQICLFDHNDYKWVNYKDFDLFEWVPADKLVIDLLKQKEII